MTAPDSRPSAGCDDCDNRCDTRCTCPGCTAPDPRQPDDEDVYRVAAEAYCADPHTLVTPKPLARMTNFRNAVDAARAPLLADITNLDALNIELGRAEMDRASERDQARRRVAELETELADVKALVAETEQRVRAEIEALAEQPRYIPFRDPLPDVVHRRVQLTPELFYDFDADGQAVGMGTTCGASALLRVLAQLAPELLTGMDDDAGFRARVESAEAMYDTARAVVAAARRLVVDPHNQTARYYWDRLVAALQAHDETVATADWQLPAPPPCEACARLLDGTVPLTGPIRPVAADGASNVDESGSEGSGGSEGATGGAV